MQTELKKKARVHEEMPPAPSHVAAPAPQHGTKETPQQSAANSAEDTVDVPGVDGSVAAGADVQHTAEAPQHTAEAPQVKTEFRLEEGPHAHQVVAPADNIAHQ